MGKTLIIAEAGINHNGSLKIARKLIYSAAKCGADYIKFQTFKTDNLVLQNAKKAPYQKKNSKDTANQYKLLKSTELKKSDFISLKKCCKKVGIKFLSSPFDIESLNFLKNFDLDFIKIPSGEITNLPFLERVGKLNRKVLLSTGMSTIHEIQRSINILVKNGTAKKNISLLQCNTAYPSPFVDANLKVINKFQKKFQLNIGYSDHTLGIEASIAAVALGAKIIEKHFTINKKLVGPDHKASLDPDEFANMVKAIRNVEVALGSKKFVTKSEKKNVNAARKSIVVVKTIKKGDFFTEKNLSVKRPGNGVSPMKWYKYINKRSKKNYNPNKLLK